MWHPNKPLILAREKIKVPFPHSSRLSFLEGVEGKTIGCCWPTYLVQIPSPKRELQSKVFFPPFLICFLFSEIRSKTQPAQLAQYVTNLAQRPECPEASFLGRKYQSQHG